jgi:predicted dehydrogenase
MSRRRRDIRAVVVGTGFVGAAHVEALDRLGVGVVGVVGSSPERARAAATSTPLPDPFESLDAVLDDPTVDVVHVATPNVWHAEQALAAIDAGKHVVCEKPLAMTAGECATLQARANAANAVNAVCFNLRFYPLVTDLRAQVRRGDFGEVRYVHGSYLQDWLLHPSDWNWRVDASIGGSTRAVADIGSHWLDMAAFLSGERIVEVLAELHTFVPTRTRSAPPDDASSGADGAVTEVLVDTDDAATILIRFESGAKGAVVVSQVAAGHRNSLSMEVDGATSAAAWTSDDPDVLWRGHRERANEVMVRDPSLLGVEAARLALYPAGHVEGYGDTFRALFDCIYDDVERGAPSPTPAYPTFADGHDAMCVVEAVARSSALERWTTVERPGRTR